MQRNYVVSALTVIVVAAFGLVYTLLRGNEPLLGLDLQGGVSVVLTPTDEATDEQLDTTVEILRARIDQIGVAEPEIAAQGQNIVVALPGVVEDQQDALDRLSQTAELVFRPVVFDFLASGATTTQGGGIPVAPDPTIEDDPDEQEIEQDEEVDAPEEEQPDETVPEEEASNGDEVSLGGEVQPVAFGFQEETETTTTTVAQDPEADQELLDDLIEQGEELIENGQIEDGSGATSEEAPTGDLDLTDLISGLNGPPECPTQVTSVDDVSDDDYITLIGDTGSILCLGPVLFTGDALESAEATIAIGDQWLVAPVFKPGANGIDLFNAAAQLCFNGAAQCPPVGFDGETGASRGRLAAVLDNQVISAPSINAPNFNRDQITISGAFSEEEARRTAEALNFGALPVELVAQETRTVSAALGSDVLEAGVISGLIGLALVAIYLLVYYRLAGLVAIGGLLLSAMLLWTIVAFLGERYGLALSISGVVGLIVSIGVSTDSNIVYFENVKEAFRTGTKVSTSAERAYSSSISTIIKADVVSLIAAVLLFFLAIGAVRGFALYLGLATILDLVISLYFMRPALIWLARRQATKNNPRLIGMPQDAELVGGSS